MTRKEVRDFVRGAVEMLSPAVQFGSGRISNFNMERYNSYPITWLESIGSNSDILQSGLPFDTYPCKLHIGKQDSDDSIADQMEGLVDDCDELAQKIIFNLNSEADNSSDVALSNVSRIPFYKDHADCITGVILSFTIQTPDKTSQCP